MTIREAAKELVMLQVVKTLIAEAPAMTLGALTVGAALIPTIAKEKRPRAFVILFRAIANAIESGAEKFEVPDLEDECT